MLKRILSAILVVLHILTQSASAMDFQPVTIRPSAVVALQFSSDILKNETRSYGGPSFSFFKISDAVVNEPLTNGQGFRISSVGTSSEMLSSPTGWMLTTAYPANSSLVTSLTMREVEAPRRAKHSSGLLATACVSMTNLTICHGDWSEEGQQGNRTKVTYPSAKAVDYVYNGLNQVTNVKVNTAAVANYTYDVLNRLAQKDLVPTAVKSAIYGYDVANQLLTVDNKITQANTLISKHTYTYDTAGNRLTHNNQTTAVTKAHTFTYNKLYELTNVTGAQTHTYAYDKLGNRTTADAVTYATNTLNQYTTVGGVALTYDKSGNTTKDNAGVLYVYDAENRLTQMTKGTVVAKYRYDGLNRRISKEIGTAKTFYVHDGDEVVEERNATGGLVADYVYGPGIDEVLTMTRGANTYYYFYDALGSVRQITNAAGAITETYDYDVFGRPLNTSTVGNPVMFTGRWFDSESGNFYYRARYYQPTLGRFLQRDPIGYGDGMNLYAYVINNPVNYVDPSGEVLQFIVPFLISAGTGFVTNAGIEFLLELFTKDSCEKVDYSNVFSEGVKGAIFGSILGGIWGSAAKYLNRIKYLDPNSIRFTQDSIKGSFSNGGSLQALSEGLKSGKINPKDIPPIRIFKRDGKIFSLDNRRLKAFQDAGRKVPTKRATKQEISNESFKFTTKNDGVSIKVRGQK